MQSCCFFLFFFSRPFHENFKFLKNCPYDFHEILHSHSTPKGAPACAKASKSYGWDVRNIAKISPKMAKKQPFFDFFRFSQKLSIRFERKFLQIFYTILESYMCNGIKIVWLGCEKQPKLAQKWSKKGHFSTSERKVLSRLLYRTCGSGLKSSLLQNLKKMKGNSLETKKIEKSRTVPKKFKGWTLQSRPVLYLKLKMKGDPLH